MLACDSSRTCLIRVSHTALLTGLLVLLQVFYHLGELDEALSYALGAGKLFDITEPSEYVQTTLGKH